MALRSTLALAAENEIGRRGQKMTDDSEFNIDSFGDQPSRPMAHSSSRQFLRGSTPFRKVSTAQQPPTLPSANEPPVVWYTQCVTQLLCPQVKAVAIKQAEVNMPSVGHSNTL